MDSASFQFVFFGLAVAVLSNLSRSRAWRSLVLMAASLLFLFLLERNPLAYLPLIGFLALGYLCLVLIRRGLPKAPVLSLLLVLFVYIWLKKYTFLPAAIFLHSPYFTLGLSYIFFRVMHLVIDCRDDQTIRKIGPFEYLLYTLNFTTFISGPIQRFDAFAEDQFAAEPLPLGPRVIGLQLERIVRGFFKVNVVAMFFDVFRQDALLELSQPLSTQVKLWAAFRLMVSYTFFLYANFSGYIDIVIALARLMRVRLPENFDRPFSAASFIDFWSRWHITLSTWFKNYVYSPMMVAMMRRISSVALQPYLGVFAFFVTFFLVGVWHGRTSEFLVYGLLQGGGVSINKLWQVMLTQSLGRKRYKALAANPAYIALARGLTFSWFTFTLLWLWAGWKQIDDVYASLSVTAWVEVWLAIWLAATVTLALWEWLRGLLLSIRAGEQPLLTHRYARTIYASALGLAAVFITILLNAPAPGIVYKAF